MTAPWLDLLMERDLVVDSLMVVCPLERKSWRQNPGQPAAVTTISVLLILSLSSISTS